MWQCEPQPEARRVYDSGRDRLALQTPGVYLPGERDLRRQRLRLGLLAPPPPRQFNLMFKTFMGPVEEDAAVTYLRPETAQGIFVNFDNVLQSMRLKLPFGIAQIGKSFRNEITPGNFIFRTLEFEQMEIEYFVNPNDVIDGRPADEVWHERWIEERFAWYQRYGIRRAHLRLREHDKEELAHYAKRTADVEYEFPMGWSELEGIANRTDFDLKQHAKTSGKALTYFDEERKTHVVPYAIEPSAGADRSVLAFLVDAYREEGETGDGKVTIRERDSMDQIRVPVAELETVFRELLTAGIPWSTVGARYPATTKS